MSGLHERYAVKSLIILAALFVFMGSVYADPSASNACVEIEALLTRIGTSDCEFYRNGIWYTGAEAQTHLKKKYTYLHERGMAETAEEFIANAATKSSVSGETYQIRCGNQTPVPSAQWLSGELQRLRAQPETRTQQ
jgi:hypothetical protein